MTGAQDQLRGSFSFFHRIFDTSEDVTIRRLPLPQPGGQTGVLLVYCQGLCDEVKLNELVVPSLLKTFQENPIEDYDDFIRHLPFQLSPLKNDRDESEIAAKVFGGELLLAFDSFSKTLALPLANPPARQTEEPNTEVSIKGPRDGFIEEISVNTALIRKRLATTQLAVEHYEIGAELKTKVNLLYHKTAIRPETLQEIKTKLDHIQVEYLSGNSQLAEVLTPFPFTLFPLWEFTGRPDFCASSLLNGRFVLLVNGSPTALIAPTSFTYLFNTPEDTFAFNFFVAFARVLRLFGFVLSIFLPGFFISLVTYHHDQLPFSLLATLVTSRQGVPLPAPFEAMVMLVLFELLREAGMRLPSSFGQTLSVVGGLIIGQAAISAGMTAPGVLVVVAISVVANFTLPNQGMVGIVSLLRILVLLFCSVFGMFGFLMSIISLVLFLVNLRSFGTYYMEPISPIRLKSLYKILYRLPWGKFSHNPPGINGDKQGESE